MKRIVNLVDNGSGATIKCRILSDMPADGDIIGKMRVKDIQEVYVGVRDGELRYKNPWEYSNYEGYSFYKSSVTNAPSCFFQLFCVKSKYLVVCQYREEDDYWTESICDYCRVLSPKELKERYAEWLSDPHANALQVLDEKNNVISEYRPDFRAANKENEMLSEKTMSIPTAEYGVLKGELWTLEEVDALTKKRNDYVKFLGVYAFNGAEYMVFFVQNKTVISQLF